MLQLNNILRRKRVLFTVNYCKKCHQWNQFVMRINAQVEPEKRIQVIDATAFNLEGIYTHPLIRLFDTYIEAFPTLFFDGREIDSTNTSLEVESYLRSALHKDFKVTPINPFISEKDCYYIKKGLFKKKTVICE